MKRQLYLFLLCLISANICCSQNGAPMNANKPNAANGGVFTPKGTLRALLVFVTYKDKSDANPNFINKEQNLAQWKGSNESGLPDFVDPITGECPAYIFNKESHFETHLDKVDRNYSKTFHLMSNGEFKLIGELFKNAEGFPVTVEVDPTKGYSWTEMNERAVAQMRKINPEFDFSRFDQRQNAPNFKFDNSNTEKYQPDGIVDFTIFIHRYSRSWKQQPNKAMRSWVGAAGGFAATGIRHTTKIGKYGFAEGFTMTYGSGVFVHEVAHVLFNAPHIMGTNNVVGEYFYITNAGWGIMAPISFFGGFNAWERWYCGFIEPVADISDLEDLENGGDSFVLRDFFTTGDAARIEIPFSNGQYLWLENHTKIHPLDEHVWKGKDLGHGDIVTGAAKGVYAYVEDIASSRNEIFSALSDRANGIKVLHAGGNYDYQMDENEVIIKNAWGNRLIPFVRGDANPISGLNNLYRFPYDKDKDGQIKIDRNYNTSRTEGMAPIYREKNAQDSFVNYYGGFGSYDPLKYDGYQGPVAFRAGDYLDLNANPIPLNYPRYNMKKAALEPYYLNGLGLKFLPVEGTDNIRVKVSYNRIDLCEDSRWTGNIRLPNITEDAQADLIINQCATLVINKSGTTNTHLQTIDGDFVKSSQFVIQKDATLLIKGKVRIQDDTELLVEEGGKIVVEAKGELIIAKTAKFTASKKEVEVRSGGKIKGWK